MKVKVTYTVDLKDVPSETGSLLTKVSSMLRDLAEGVENIETGVDSELAALQKFDPIRKDLFTVDNLLADVEGILRGYVHTINNQSPKARSKDDE